MNKPVFFTKEGLKKLKDELEYLTTVERKRISAQIAEARDKGDLSENAEYEAAKDAQALLEMRIAKLQEIISNARVIEENQLTTDEVRMFSTVTVKNLKTNKEITYTIVSENETDAKAKKISVTSPIGKSLIGKKVGDVVKVNAPAGVIDLEVISIEPMKF